MCCNNSFFLKLKALKLDFLSEWSEWETQKFHVNMLEHENMNNKVKQTYYF